jgi:hypothetical protein
MLSSVQARLVQLLPQPSWRRCRLLSLFVRVA